MIVTEGSANVTVPFYFVDDVGGTAPGEPTTGLLFSDIETGGSASYQRQGAARVDFTLKTLANAASAHDDGGFILIDDTEMPGTYRCDVPDAAFADGVDFVIIYLRAAAANNTITRPIKIDLTVVDLRDGVNGGMTALPAAAADTAGGLVISDAGGLDLDAKIGALTFTTANKLDSRVDNWAGTAVSAGVGGDGLPASIDLVNRNAWLIEGLRPDHTWQDGHFWVDPINGDTHANGNRGGKTDPYLTIQDCHDNAITDWGHAVMFLVAGDPNSTTTHTSAATTTISKNYVSIRGPGRDVIITRSTTGDTLTVTGDGVEISGVQIETAGTGVGKGIQITDADFCQILHCWINGTRGDGVNILRGSNCFITETTFQDSGASGAGQGVHIVGTGGSSNSNRIVCNHFDGVLGDAILIENGTTNDTTVQGNTIHNSTGWGVNVGGSSTGAFVADNMMSNNSSGNVTDAGATTVQVRNRNWLSSTVEGRPLDVTAGGAAGIDWANVENPTTAVDLTATKILWNALWDTEVESEVADALAVFWTSPATLVALIWNEIISKANYNIGQSAAKFLRQGGEIAQIDGAVSDVSPSVSSFDTNLTQIDTFFDDALLVFSNGSANAGIGMPVAAYLNANGNFSFIAPDVWPVTPVDGDDFIIYGIHVHPVSQIADGVLRRAVENVEDTADRHSLGAAVMVMTNSDISGTDLTARKPSDNSIFQVYTVVVDAAADPIVGVS